MIKKIAVFCGSASGTNPIYIEEAKRLGSLLAEQNRGLVYGGAQVGCMGAIANQVLEKEGHVHGVIPKKLMRVEVAHHHLTQLDVVETMHERKARMAELADAFVALPGGAGTLEEWFEVFTWAQLGYHQKPCGVLNVAGFYDPFLSMIDHTIEQGFMNPQYKELIIVADSSESLLKQLDDYEPISISKWSEG
ncbi:MULTISPECIES: TIGR00730 family Rossman fold protein [Bacillaceae]|uniref:LOG family protein n=1 Tax=Shouchella oshimensis TaxID=290588 RepID=UPI000A6B6948|nr:TIGR00730 family Rossman fold protein [Alkalicoccobacillus plakortidis]